MSNWQDGDEPTPSFVPQKKSPYSATQQKAWVEPIVQTSQIRNANGKKTAQQNAHGSSST
jgi:hypothetical protein